MKAFTANKFIVSLFFLCISSFAAASFAQSTFAPIASPSAVSLHRKLLPTLPHPVSVKRDLKSGKITDQLPQHVLEVYDHGDPTAEEQYIMEMINRARANPTAEGIRLANSTDPDVVFSYSYWPSQGDQHFATPANVKAAFATYPVQPPLAFNKHLIQAARGHSQDMITHNYQGHVDFDGTALYGQTGRLAKAGYTGYDQAGENVAAYSDGIEYTEDGLEIDFGDQNQQDLGHRKNIMNFTSDVFYTEIGIGALHGGSGLPNVGTIVTTEDFGHIPGDIFITGVVYGDDNHNNFYDIGEGLGGVTITVSDGSGSAVSSTSGGYAIPFTAGAGTVTVTASGGLLTSPITHQVSLEDVNVKVDFIQGGTGLPDQSQALFPISDTVVHTDSVTFAWATISGATKYRFQLATDAAMKKLINNDSTLTTRTKKFGPLKNDSTYYWRVQARNAAGWGQYSPIVSFSVGLPPKAPALLSPANGVSVSPDNDIVLKWRNTNPQANDFWIELSTSPTMANPIHSDTLFPEPDTTITYPMTEFSPGMTYYWRVRAENENGMGAPSAISSFTTTVSGVASSNGGASLITVSPNPTTGETHIRFSVAKSSEVSLKVFGITGAEESLTPLGRLEPNSYDILWNGAGKSPGVYFFELLIGDKRQTGRIIVTK